MRVVTWSRLIALLGVWALSGMQTLWAGDGMRELPPESLRITMLPMAKGLIEAVDLGTGELTVSHPQLYDVNLPAGTSVFRFHEQAQNGRWMPGDSVFLIADRVDGHLVIRRMVERHPD